MTESKLSRLIGSEKFFPLVWVLISVALLISLGTFDLRGEEPRRATIAMEMVESGNYLIPHLLGEVYYNKPPLYNWIIVAFHALFGSWEEWVMRLPGALSLLLLAAVNYRYVRTEVDAFTATWSSLIFLTSGELLFYGSVLTGEIDPFFALITYLQFLAIYHYSSRKKWLLLFVISYLLTAVGFMAKGMPAGLFQGITLIVVLAYWKEAWRLFSLYHLAGILVFFGLTGWYFYAYQAAGGDAVTYLLNLVKEASQKSFVESGFLKIILHLLSFPFGFLVLLLPWPLVALWVSWKKWRAITLPPLVTCAALFVIANLVIYWISPGTRNPYLYPFFPMMALVIATILKQATPPQLRKIRALLLLLVVVRLVYNFTLMPYQQRGITLEDELEQIIERVGEDELVYLCDPEVKELEVGIGENRISRQVLGASYIRYVIPYRYYKDSGKLLRVRYDAPERGRYYLVPEAYKLDAAHETLYKIESKHVERRYQLVLTE